MLAPVVWAKAQVPEPDTTLWVTEGPVRDVVKLGNTIYMAGNFTAVGPRTGCGIVVDGVTGKVISPSKTRINGYMNAAIPDQKGGWYIGGNFNQVGSVRRNGLAHLLPDGSLDENWDPQLIAFNSDPFVHALCLSGDVLYFSGRFEQVGGELRMNLAAVNVASGQPTAWSPYMVYGYAHRIAVHNNTVYLAGDFNQMSGAIRDGLAAVDATTGEPSSWNPAPNGEPKSLLVAGNQLFVSGSFTSLAGQTRNRLASFDLASGELTAWHPDPDGTVGALAFADGLLYVGGRFTSIAGVSKNLLAAFDPVSGQITPWNPRLLVVESTSAVDALAVVGNTVYMAGGVSIRNEPNQRFAGAVLTTTGELTSWNPKVSGAVSAIAAGSNGSLLVGGNFKAAGGVSRRQLAAFDATTGEVTPWAPKVDRRVATLLATPEAIYIGGGFGSINGQSRSNLAAVDPVTGELTPWYPHVNGAVASITATPDKIYFNGGFTSVNGQGRIDFAAVDRVTAQLADWNPNPSGSELDVYTDVQLIASETTIFVQGEFRMAGDATIRNFIASDATTGKLSDWNLRPNGRISGVALYGNRLYISGSFTKLGDKDRRYLAAVDATSGEVTDWSHDLTSPVGEFGIINNKIYASGGYPRRNEREKGFAVVDAISGTSTYFGFTPYMGYINKFAAAGDRVFVLGEYTGYDQQGYVFGPWVTSFKVNRGLTSTIKGTVFDDRNKNCVRDKGEKGVGNVIIEVKPGNYRALSDAQGNYSIAADTGTYAVRQLLPVLKDTVARQICPATENHPVRISAYGLIAAIDFSNELTATYNVIKGKVFIEKTEDCAQMFGEAGLKNIKVVVEPTGAFAYTDAEGNYAIRVDTGTYRVKQIFSTSRDTLLQTVCPGPEYHSVQFTTLGNTATKDFADRLVIRYNLIKGRITLAENGSNCTVDPAAKPMAGMKVMAEPGLYYGITDSTGQYVIKVDTGRYTVVQMLGDQNGTRIIQPCPLSPVTHAVSFPTYNNTVTGRDFSNQVILRPHLTAGVTSSRRRRCFPSTTTLSYCNIGNAAATDVKVHLQLPQHVVLVTASAPYTRDKDKNYVFNLGELKAGQCGNIQVQDSVVCNDPNIRGLTQCTSVWITPANGTTPDPGWDQSDITLKARCLANGVVRLALYNTGTGNMADSAAFRVLLDARLALGRNFKLAAGDSLILRVPANGRTVRLEADQRPGHPTKSSTNVTLEACGTNADGGVSLGFVAQLPGDDQEPEVAEECLPITDSFDPNDKLVRPAGTTDQHYTPTGTALSYTVRFQNTGNDYAYTVVVVDTLSEKLDFSTLQIGAVSHPYRFTVSGKGRPVLTFTFNNINLPDSARDQAGSNGFIQFSIKPVADLPAKTLIENFADIFFDYNPPVRTNTTANRIFDVPYVVEPSVRLDENAVIVTPVLTSFTPASGTTGTVVTLTGKHFDAVPGHNAVTFNGIAAPVTAATATTLTVAVPPGEAAGRIRVGTPDGVALSTTDFLLATPPPTAVTPGLLAAGVRIYPNPAPGRFVVAFTGSIPGVTEVVILDARGVPVRILPLAGKRADRAEVDLTGHPAGMYLVLIRTEHGTLARKVTLRP